MSEKIKSHHLERKAYVYVRQSTPYQVRNHLESKRRQYALAERAKQLGFANVIVIDDDLGRSGDGMRERPGFGKLLTSVCQGLAGAVFALEASRLARSNAERAFATHAFSVSEGVVRDFVPMPPGGHATESFVVNGVRFEYGGGWGSTMFNSAWNKGFIHNGVEARIMYVDKGIIKIEVK